MWEEVVTEALEEAVLRKAERVKAAYLQKAASVKEAAETLIAEIISEIVKEAFRKEAECVIENERKKEAEFVKEDEFVEDDECVKDDEIMEEAVTVNTTEDPIAAEISKEAEIEKEKEEETKEETLGEQLKSFKRKKSIATKKPRVVKKPRVEPVKEKKRKVVKEKVVKEKVVKKKKDEPKDAEEEEAPQSSSAQQQSNAQCDMYITVVNTDPIKAIPLSSKPPEIIFWDTLVDGRSEYIRVKRANGAYEAYRTWGSLIRKCSRSDLEEMHKEGMRLYGNLLRESGMSITKMVLEFLCMMFQPEAVQYVIKQDLQKVSIWLLHENCGVYTITIDSRYQEYYLVDKIYTHSQKKLDEMLHSKLVCNKGSEMGRFLVRRILNQSVGMNPDLGDD